MRFLLFLFTAAGTVICFLTLAGFGGGYAWSLDLASHFRVQYLVCLALAALVVGLGRRFWLAAVFAAFAAWNLALILPLYDSPARPAAPDGEALRAYWLNVNTANRNAAALLASIDRHKPDFILLAEVNDRWTKDLRTLSADYPHKLERPRPDNFGIALYSRHPLQDQRVLDLGAAGVPSLLVRAAPGGRDFYLLGTHTLPPIGPTYARRRNLHLAAIPDLAASLEAPLLLLGDLNATPWSYNFKRLLAASALRNGARGRGLQPTWPAPLWPLRIPIDHSLHSTGIEIRDRLIGEAVGSDHYPVIVDYAVVGE